MDAPAVILAGGMGTRLRSVVGNLPKPLAPVAGRPFLFYVLEHVAAARPKHVVLSVGYMAQSIIDVVGDVFAGIPILYAVEEEPLGTGGAILQAASQAANGTLLVLNGDTFAEVDLREFHDAHLASGASLSLALAAVPDTSRYGRVEMEGDRIVAFGEKGRGGPGLINAGVYAIDRDLIMQYRRAGAFSFETDVLGPNLRAISPRGERFRGTFIDIGIPDDYRRAQEMFR